MKKQKKCCSTDNFDLCLANVYRSEVRYACEYLFALSFIENALWNVLQKYIPVGRKTTEQMMFFGVFLFFQFFLKTLTSTLRVPRAVTRLTVYRSIYIIRVQLCYPMGVPPQSESVKKQKTCCSTDYFDLWFCKVYRSEVRYDCEDSFWLSFIKNTL